MFKAWFLPKNKKKKHLIDSLAPTPERVRTPVTALEIGMYVAELDRSWLETDFLFQGFEIDSEAVLQKLRETCNFVFIDTTKRKKRAKHIRSEPKIPQCLGSYPEPPPKISNFEDEIQRSDQIYRSTGALVADFMDRIARGEDVDAKVAKQAVAECVNSVLHSPDAHLWLTQLKNKDEYTAQHSLNVCVLSVVLGRHIGLGEQSLNNLGLCGMMHDVGKMLVPLEVLNKPGRLDDDEMRIMQSHTTLGYELLKSSKDMYFGASETAFMHHERLDGQGYPRKKLAHDLSLYTKIVTVTDMYDAITSDRVYQKGRTHLEAIKIMFDMMGLHLEETLVVKFVESLGVYPPGCFVEMTNGCIGLVVEINEASRLRPKVLLILDQDRNAVTERVIDLAAMPQDETGSLYTIRRIAKASDYGINAAEYYQMGVLQKGFALGRRQ